MAQRAPELFSDDDETEDFFKSGGQDAPEREEQKAPEPEEQDEQVETESEDTEAAEQEEEPEAEEAEQKEETEEQEAERRQVPLAALREERKRRKELQDELRESRRKMYQMEQAWQQVQQRLNQPQQQQQPANQQQAQQPQQQPEQQAPDYDEDPAGYLRWQQEQLQQKLNEIDQWRNQQLQSRTQDAETQRFAAVVNDYENQFRNRAPDYDEAVHYLKTRRDNELKSWGVMDPQQRQNIVNQEVMFLANAALQNGDSPAERAYEMAKSWGYTPSQARQAAQEAEQASQQEQERQQSTKQNTQKMGKLKKGTQASKSLSKSKGEPPVNMTLEGLADIDDPSEFDKQWEKLFGKSPII